MKNNRIVFLVVLLTVLCTYVCSCKLEHGHFEFIIEEFKNLDQNAYVISDTLDHYKIQDIIIRPWIKNVYDDVTYSVGVYGYSKEQVLDKTLTIGRIHLFTKDKYDLVNMADSNTVVNYSQDDANACFVGNKICQFTGAVDTINGYGTLYMELSVTVSDSKKTESRTFLYEIDIVQYLTAYTIT